MKAVVLTENAVLKCQDIPLREIPSRYRVKVAFVGICGSDIGRGFKSGAYRYPLVMLHFHTGECNRMVPGRGRMPWHEIAQALHDIQYTGNVVMEPFVRMGGTVGSDIKVWRDISNGASEAQLDEDAKKALEFERYMFE